MYPNRRGNNKMKMILIVVAILLAVAPGFAQANDGLRKVKGRTLTSNDTPAVELEFGKAFKYVGGHKFVLYDVANAEQHFFVDADKNGRVTRLFWVQFEGYLPSNDKSYRYKGPKEVNIDGLNFFADTWTRNIKENPGRPDGDGARGRAFLESKGFRLGSDETLTLRLLHFIGEKKRDELMIIYMEDLSSTMGLTAADFAAGGKAEAKWNEIADALLTRARKDMKIRPRS